MKMRGNGLRLIRVFFRLVFEIEYVGQLYEDYKPIRLDIWRAFTDTTMSSLQIKVKQGE